MKLITRLRGTISVIRVNHEDEALSVLEVVPANNPVMEDWSELGVSVQAPAMGQDFWCNTARVTQEQYEGLVYDKLPLNHCLCAHWLPAHWRYSAQQEHDAPPERPNFVLPSHVPHGEVDVLVLNRLDVEANGRDGGDDLTELELVQDRGL